MSHSLRRVIALAFCVMLLALIPSALSAAGTITVNNADPACVSSAGQASPYTVVYCTIEDAVTDSAMGDTINVAAGTYTPGLINLNKDGVTLNGAGAGLTIVQVSGTGDRFDISGNGVTLQNFEIVKTDKTGEQNIIRLRNSNITIKSNKIHGQFVIGDGDVSRAMIINAGAFTGIDIEGNTIYDLRQPAYVSGAHTGVIQNNDVYNTKGWVFEGGDLTFKDNTWGTGAQPNVYDVAILGTMPAASYTDIVAMSAANNDAVIEDQRVSPAVLSVVYVDAATAYNSDLGGRYHPYSSITPAVTRVVAGGTVNLAAGTYDTTAATVINKALTLAGPPSGGAKLQGTNGANPSVLEISASNVTVKNLEITHSALQSFSYYPSWVELSQCLVCVKNGSGLTGISIKDNVIAVPQQSGSMGTWSGIGLTVGNATTTGITIDGNTIYNTRNGIVVQRNNTATLTNNTIYNTKGGIMNYTGGDADAANRTMTANAWGSAHNEWDVVWNTGVYYTPANRSASVLGVSTANNGAYVIDRRAADATAEANLIHNRSHVFVDAASSLNTPHAAKGSQAEPFKTLELGWDAVIQGGTVFVRTGTYTISEGTHPGGLVVTGDGAKINLNGATVGAGSPAFTIVGDDIEINGPGTLDGGGSTSPAILVQAGADNFTLDGVEIKNWADGVQVAGSHASLKLVNNWLHDNGTGFRFNSDAALTGVVTIEGNLFKFNTGNGIQNDSSANINALYNSWGAIGGPSAGDGVSANVTATPFTFVEVYTDAALAAKNVVEGDTFTVNVQADAAGMYAVQYKLAYDPTLLQVVSVTASGDFGSCVNNTAIAGEVTSYCALQGASDLSGVGKLVNTITFKVAPDGSHAGESSWTTYLDLKHNDGLAAAARDGIKAWVDNAGFGAPSSSSKDITDAQDGTIVIAGLANYTGYIDLQGRTNDSGAKLNVYNQLAKSGATLLAAGTSASSGRYTTAYETGKQLVIGQTYYFQVDRDLYLPTTIVTAADWAHSKLLSDRPATLLANVVLLGGDATNDDQIDNSDATCIGGSYGAAPQACGTSGSSDVNGDGKVDILDLTLMGGNYTKTSSTWTP